MDPDSVLDAFHITPSISFSSAWDSHYTRLTITPKTRLNYNTEYHVSLAQEASDQIGHPLVEPYAWVFKTEKQQTSQSSSTSGFKRPYTGFSNLSSSFGYSTNYNFPSFRVNLSGFSSGGYSTSFRSSPLTSYAGSSFGNFRYTNPGSYNYGSSYLAGRIQFPTSYQLGSSYFQNVSRNFQMPSFMTSNRYFNNPSGNWPRF